MSMRATCLRLWLLGLTGLVLAGCTPLKQPAQTTWPWSRSKVDESAYQQPERMIVIWSDAIYSQPGARPTRGFGGRVYFYNEKAQPIPVEGQLVVYAYDDTHADITKAPDRKFVFTAEQFTRHFSESELGASYSVWLPWDAAGGYQKQVSLLPVFTATGGKVVMGNQASTVLPGRTEHDVAPAPNFSPLLGANGGISPVGYQTPARHNAAVHQAPTSYYPPVGHSRSAPSTYNAGGYEAASAPGINTTVHDMRSADPGRGLQTTTITIPPGQYERILASTGATQSTAFAATTGAAPPGATSPAAAEWIQSQIAAAAGQPLPPSMPGTQYVLDNGTGLRQLAGTSPDHTVSQRARAGTNPWPRSTRFERQPHPVRGASAVRPTPAHAAMTPSPAGPPSGLPSGPALPPPTGFGALAR